MVCYIYFSGEFHLGYSSSEIYGRSWYEMIHPEDVHEAREKHVQCKYSIFKLFLVDICFFQ